MKAIKPISKKKKKKYFSQSTIFKKAVRVGLLICILCVFTIMIYPNLMTVKVTYKIGDVAEYDIKAHRDFHIENKHITDINRQNRVAQILTVYDHDPDISKHIVKNINTAFNSMAVLFEEYHNTTEEDVLPDKSDFIIKVRKLEPQFEEQLGIKVNRGAFLILEKEKFSRHIAQLIIRIIRDIQDNGVVANKEILLREYEKGIRLRGIVNNSERVIYNLKKYYGLDQAETMVRIVAQPLVKGLNYNLVNLIVDFCQALLQPNITLNRNETTARRKKAFDDFKPVLNKIKAGEMLVREGERITPIHAAKLKQLYSQNTEEEKKTFERSIGADLLVLSLILVIYFLYSRKHGRIKPLNNKELWLIVFILMILFCMPKVSTLLFQATTSNLVFTIPPAVIVFGIPLASGSMLICLFLGFDMAVLFAVLISVCTAIILNNRLEIFIYFVLSGVMAAYWMQDCRERKAFIKAGLKLGILNMALSSVVVLYHADFNDFILPWSWAFAFWGGIASGIIAAGFTPFLEMAFGFRTDITLLELSNLDQPLLRCLMLEAPGTYHHSMVVGSMVEAAAIEINSNPLLAKVCGYYHDIGKIKKPLYFVENQADCKNKHDKLAPSMSALILISHVKEGVEMAKSNKLGREIIDAIRQHHGTSTIKFFYEKARKLKGDEHVKIEDFKYPGPMPQTREAGLVMLADVVEAASRTLQNPTPSRIKSHVRKLIDSIFTEGQLNNCELTMADLHKISNSFNMILTGIHHHRIEYPEKNSNGKEKNGHPDKQPSKPQDSSKFKTERTSNLKGSRGS